MSIDTSRLPADASQFTAAWLTDALHESGALPAASTVTRVQASPLGAGAGLIAMLSRLELTYGGAPTSLPTRMIAKFPSSAPANRAVADTYDMYGREVQFYRTLAQTTSIGLPRSFLAVIAEKSSDFVLLLEDLSDRRIGDQVLGSDIDDANVVIDAMAALHAEHWNRTDEARFAWLTPHANDMQIGGMEAGFAAGWPKFCADHADIIPPAVLKWGHRVGPATRPILEALCGGQLTVCHADFRLENMFFAAQPGHEPFAIIDWQSITKSSGGQDLSYYLTQSVNVDVRRKHERDLLARYLEGLRKGGVRDYSADDLMLDYRRATLYLLDYAVVIASTLDLANERGAAIARALVERSCVALDDLDCGALLP